MPAPKIALELIDRFDRNLEAYRSGHYNEAQMRAEFIDPLFEALGWDIYNKEGIAEAYKDVVHEDAIKVGGSTKAPDYSFRIGGTRKFFLEAKKPSIDIKGDPNPAYQLRRYAWSAKLPLSILTDFEEFAVYDCRVKPVKTDKPSAARIMYLTYRDYADRWDELFGLFSKNAVLKGDFDRFVASTTRKRGTAEVDNAFLTEIETWRDALARNIALRNTGLSQREVNFAVGRTIDRIIFLRICEDRGIEEPNRLMALQNGTNVYRRLIDLYHRADEKYNSGLFHFRKERDRPMPPDELTLKLTIDDKVLKDIFKGFYYPESPYEFSVLPADILGQVYEQFLGKVIRLTSAHHAKVEDKPEVKKAGGVYYTPTYIVDYIVKHTVGKLLEGKTPKDVGANSRSPIRILDPACGSGSFLLGAYKLLLDWHRDWYVEQLNRTGTAHRDPTDSQIGRVGATRRVAHTKEFPIYQAGEKEYRLTTAERKRILLNNIYGVDIDPQAVEVTKLSLLLKVLEEESAETINRQLKLLHERALPDLGSNIKCGNSLIGPDFYIGQQLDLLDEEERLRINVFYWEAEFPEIFNRQARPERSRGDAKMNGFDAVIGNPPYLFITEIPKEMRDYYYRTYNTVSYRFDLYGSFIEKAAKGLLAPGGVFGFIIPHTLLSNDSFANLRRLLAAQASIYKVVDFGPGVFHGPKNETMLLFFESYEPTRLSKVEVTCTSPKIFPDYTNRFISLQDEWAKRDGSPWLVRVSGNGLAIVNKLEALERQLANFCTANQGLRTGNNEKYLSDKPHGDLWKPAAGGKQVARYAPLQEGLYVLYDIEFLDAPRKPEIFSSNEKIVVQEVRNIALKRRIVATLDSKQVFCLQSTNVINLRPESELAIRYVLGVLNSAIVNFLFRSKFPGNNHIPSNQLLRIPIPEPKDRTQHDLMVSLVERMLSLHQQLAAARTEHEQTALQRQIGATDRQVNKLVYELYGLGEEEINIVEGDSNE